MSDREIITGSILDECVRINGENYLLGKIEIDLFYDFRNLIARSNYYRRLRFREVLFWSNNKLVDLMNSGENIYLVDPVPVTVCRTVMEKPSKICWEDFEIANNKGYFAANKGWYSGYILHLITSVFRVYTSIELTKTSMYDLQNLCEIKHSDLIDCTLIADKGCISEPIRLDLFTTCHIRTETSKTSYQHSKDRFPIIFKRARKHTKTLLVELCDQLILKLNYAKSREGITIRLFCIITTQNIIHYLNDSNNKSLNHLKYFLAA